MLPQLRTREGITGTHPVLEGETAFPNFPVVIAPTFFLIGTGVMSVPATSVRVTRAVARVVIWEVVMDATKSQSPVFRLFMSSPSTRRPLILDLDFTLLHLEYVPDALEVPGRTRSAWIAPQTIDCLKELQTRFDIVLATARSWDGTQWVSDGFERRGVKVSGVVLEDGAILGVPSALKRWDSSFDVELLRASVEQQRANTWPLFDWQFDFKSCLVARCESHIEAAHLSAIFAEHYASESERRIYQDGRKVYILPGQANKWSALQKLLGERADTAAGVGDGINDLVWLPRVQFPATFASADTHLVQAIQRCAGYISPLDGHSGIIDILHHIGESATAQGQA